MKKIYLHVGMNKTGTSSIQSFFANNQEALLERGILYPKTARDKQRAHHPLTKILRQGDKNTLEVRDKQLQKLVHEIETSGCDTVFLSSENFVKKGIDYQALKEKLGDAVVPVVYLRRHDEWWISLYQQAIKMMVDPPWERGFRAFLNFQKKSIDYWKYAQFVDQLGEVFGERNVIVRPYESCQLAGNNVCHDILAVLGVELDQQLQATIEAQSWENTSVGAFNLMLISELMRVRLHAGLRHNVIRVLRRIPGDMKLAGLMDAELKKELINENISDYQYIARKYLKRDDGQLFYALEPKPPQHGARAWMMRKIFRVN